MPPGRRRRSLMRCGRERADWRQRRSTDVPRAGQGHQCQGRGRPPRRRLRSRARRTAAKATRAVRSRPGADPLVGGRQRHQPAAGSSTSGESLADCSRGSGRGRRADGARERAVLAGDVPGARVGRGARRRPASGARERFWTAALTDERYRENRVGVDRAGRRAWSGSPCQARPWTTEPRRVQAAVVLDVPGGRPRHRCGGRAAGGGARPEESVALRVADPNPRAQAFCRAHGFVADGTAQVDGERAGDPHGPRHAATQLAGPAP